MKLEQIQQETENLKTLDVTSLTPEQLQQLVEKISSLVDNSETALSQINIEDNEADNS
jgi:hypothetical protein